MVSADRDIEADRSFKVFAKTLNDCLTEWEGQLMRVDFRGKIWYTIGYYE